MSKSNLKGKTYLFDTFSGFKKDDGLHKKEVFKYWLKYPKTLTPTRVVTSEIKVINIIFLKNFNIIILELEINKFSPIIFIKQ